MTGKVILITGGTGFLGSRIAAMALARGDTVFVLTRNVATAAKTLPSKIHCFGSLDEIVDPVVIDIVVNLAGEPLVSGRWNKARKQVFYESRVGVTNRLYEFFSRSGAVPKVVISGSAIGYYGPQHDRELDEEALTSDSFSHQLCKEWEAAALQFTELGSRVCLLRTGIVLDKNHGALSKMLPAFRFGLGGPMGTGKQWMSWVHIDGFVELVFHCLKRTDILGAVNATAPGAVTNQDFARALVKVLKRPSVLRMFSPAVRLLFGEMGNELLLSGQNVFPRKAVETGFKFSYPELEPALQHILAD